MLSLRSEPELQMVHMLGRVISEERLLGEQENCNKGGVAFKGEGVSLADGSYEDKSRKCGRQGWEARMGRKLHPGFVLARGFRPGYSLPELSKPRCLEAAMG